MAATDPTRFSARALVLALILSLPGLASAQHQQAPPQQQTPKGYLLHLPGIGGFLHIDHTMLNGLKSSDLNAEIDHYDWTAGDPGLDALLAYDRNQKQATTIAEMITKKFRADPKAPIYLTSHSGGAGLLVWALEKCPADVKVDSVFFLAPALSPGYDLSKALAHVTNHAYVFYSQLDPVLGPGTKNFGTIDRIKTEAAGYLGFSIPKTADNTLYAKLQQFPYKDAYAAFNNFGDHIGPMSTDFALHVLAPLLGAHPKPAQAATPATQPAGVGS